MDEALAKDNLKRAIKHAKKSADLTQLAKIYLGECALNISVGREKMCSNYEEISGLVEDNSLDAYYNLLTLNISELKIELLPQSYQAFAHMLIENKFKKAQDEILKIQKPSSALICAALIKENIDSNTREKMIQLASFNGYKKSVLFWLEEKLKKSEDEAERQKIKKRISILTT